MPYAYGMSLRWMHHRLRIFWAAKGPPKNCTNSSWHGSSQKRDTREQTWLFGMRRVACLTLKFILALGTSSTAHVLSFVSMCLDVMGAATHIFPLQLPVPLLSWPTAHTRARKQASTHSTQGHLQPVFRHLCYIGFQSPPQTRAFRVPRKNVGRTVSMHTGSETTGMQVLLHSSPLCPLYYCTAPPFVPEAAASSNSLALVYLPPLSWQENAQ